MNVERSTRTAEKVETVFGVWLTGRCQHTKIRCCASTSDGLLNHYRTGTTGTKKEPPQGHRFSQDFGKDKAVRPGLRLF